MATEREIPDAEHASRALSLYRRMGWKDDKSEYTVRLVHPKGRERFEDTGAVFLDRCEPGRRKYRRLCVLFPGQRLPSHHHRERAEVFRVVGGKATERLGPTDEGPSRAREVVPGDFLRPGILETHSLEAGKEGCTYVGVCDVEHLADVFWDEEVSGEHRERMTLVDPSGVDDRGPAEEWWSHHPSVDLEHELLLAG